PHFFVAGGLPITGSSDLFRLTGEDGLHASGRPETSGFAGGENRATARLRPWRNREEEPVGLHRDDILQKSHRFTPACASGLRRSSIPPERYCTGAPGRRGSRSARGSRT